MSMPCAGCGRVGELGERFCPRCGQPLPATPAPVRHPGVLARVRQVFGTWPGRVAVGVLLLAVAAAVVIALWPDPKSSRPALALANTLLATGELPADFAVVRDTRYSNLSGDDYAPVESISLASPIKGAPRPGYPSVVVDKFSSLDAAKTFWGGQPYAQSWLCPDHEIVVRVNGSALHRALMDLRGHC